MRSPLLRSRFARVLALSASIAAVPFAATAAAADAPPPGEPAPLVQATATAKATAASAGTDVTHAVDAITPLAAQRKAALTATAAQRKSVDKHLKAAESAFKRYKTQSEKSPTDPKTLALLETAKTEYEAAISEGTALQTALATLRKTEEQLASQVVAAAGGSATAEKAAASADGAVKALKALAAARTKDAKSAATAAATEASKSRTTAGLGPSSGFAARKAKNEVQDHAFSTRVAGTRTALDDVTGSRKGK